MMVEVKHRPHGTTKKTIDCIMLTNTIQAMGRCFIEIPAFPKRLATMLGILVITRHLRSPIHAGRPDCHSLMDLWLCHCPHSVRRPHL